MNPRYKIIIVLLIIAGALIWVFGRSPATVVPTPEPVVTNPEPIPSETDSWLTQIDGGATFRYPAELGTTYIHTQDWPPMAQVLNEPYSCTEAGATSETGGATKKVMVNGHEYCRTIESEGAAGSRYDQYAYANSVNNKTVILTFTIKSVQCGNYNDPQMTECETERASFDMDKIVEQMFGTLVLSQ